MAPVWRHRDVVKALKARNLKHYQIDIDKREDWAEKSESIPMTFLIRNDEKGAHIVKWLGGVASPEEVLEFLKDVRGNEPDPPRR